MENSNQGIKLHFEHLGGSQLQAQYMPSKNSSVSVRLSATQLKSLSVQTEWSKRTTSSYLITGVDEVTVKSLICLEHKYRERRGH